MGVLMNIITTKQSVTVVRPPCYGTISQALIQHEEEHNRYELFDDGWPGYEELSFICD